MIAKFFCCLVVLLFSCFVECKEITQSTKQLNNKTTKQLNNKTTKQLIKHLTKHIPRFQSMKIRNMQSVKAEQHLYYIISLHAREAKQMHI